MCDIARPHCITLSFVLKKRKGCSHVKSIIEILLWNIVKKCLVLHTFFKIISCCFLNVQWNLWNKDTLATSSEAESQSQVQSQNNFIYHRRAITLVALKVSLLQGCPHFTVHSAFNKAFWCQRERPPFAGCPYFTGFSVVIWKNNALENDVHVLSSRLESGQRKVATILWENIFLDRTLWLHTHSSDWKCVLFFDEINPEILYILDNLCINSIYLILVRGITFSDFHIMLLSTVFFSTILLFIYLFILLKDFYCALSSCEL
jgi:hypothetical protein